MAYRGGGGRGGGRGGDRGDQRPPYGHGGAGGSGGGGGGGRPFIWPPPPSTPRPAPPAPYTVPVTMGYGVPMAVYRPSGQAAVFRAPAPAAPQVTFSPAPPAAPVTIRAPPPSSTTSPAAPSSTPATPRQPAPQSASTPASEPAPAASSAPSAAALAKEVEKKLFVSETALAPPAAAAVAAVAAAQGTAAAGADDASDLDLAPVSKKGLAHPARPGLATVGKKVMIRANHFVVNVADNNLFHYDVAINPESKSRATSREVLNELIKLHGKTALGGKLPAYDGRKSLYTAGSLPFESEEFVVTLVDAEKKEKERAEREYKITIRIAGRTDLYHLQQFLRGRQRDMPQETIQVLDVVLRELPSWNYVTVSRSFFSTTFGHRGDIGEGLGCWRGYYQSLHPTQMGLSLNIDISATSFFKPVTVIKFVEECLNMRDTSRPLSDRDRVKIKKALRGIRIETTHQQDQIRRYKITGVTPIPMSQLIFPVDDKGTRKTVVQYFWDKYNYSLKYGSWPCFQAGSDSRPVYLPMEVCKIVEGQRYSKKLNDRQVTNILRATCKRPQEREPSICDMVLHNKYADDRFAQEFGIKVSSDLVTVPARVLPPPLLKYHDSGREKTCAPSVGQWNMINKKMINKGTIDNWTCLYFSHMRPEEAQRFCMDLIHMCNATGMVVNPRPFVEVKSAAPNHIENALRDVHRRSTQMLAQQGVGNQLQLLTVTLPEVSGSYGKIKRVSETDIGIVSQCCLLKHASRPNKQYLENVALKINVKVGGHNMVLERAFVGNGIPFVSEVPTIIFGADVTHPPPGEDSASSIAAVVASMDWPEITKYRGLVSAQPHRQEIIEYLFTVAKDPRKGHNVNGGIIRELLIAFCRKTNRRPERIIFNRDGVSEGQFSHVLLHEMDAIRKACASLEEEYLPPVTFVVVQKRHHTWLFPEVHGRRDMTDKIGNILPGTVVDQKICHPTEFDFYLCSHAGIEGTSRPTHYHVLYDENHFTADALQSLTNNLCYTDAHCSSGVSVVLPAHYDQEIELRIGFYGKYYRVKVKKNTPLEKAVAPILASFKLKPEECFFTMEGLRGLRKEMLVSYEMTVEINVSLLGGVVPGPQMTLLISLDEWIGELGYPKGWFQCIYIPLCLRRSDNYINEVLCLGPKGAQLVLIKLLDWLENVVHKQKLSFGPGFRLQDLRYNRVLGVIVHNPAAAIAWEPLTENRYRENCRIILEFINRWLIYDNDNTVSYPMHVEDLKKRIENMTGEENYSSDEMRYLIYNCPATLTLPKQIGLISNLMIKNHRGFSSQDKVRFEKILSDEETSGEWEWRDAVSDKDAAPEMKRIYEESKAIRGQEFHSARLGRLQFSRCILNHGKGASDIQILAALYVLWKGQLPQLQYLLLMQFDDERWPECVIEDDGKVVKKRKLALPPLVEREAEIGNSGFIESRSLPEKNETDMKDLWDR